MGIRVWILSSDDVSSVLVGVSDDGHLQPARSHRSRAVEGVHEDGGRRMTRACVFCGEVRESMRYSAHATCMPCLDAVIEQVLSVRFASRQVVKDMRGAEE